MSFRHLEALREVRTEFESVRACTKHVRDNWAASSADLDSVKLHEVTTASHRLEATYIVRLTASYEAVPFDALIREGSRAIDEKSSGIALTDHLSGALQDQVKAGRSRLTSDDRKRITRIKELAAAVRKLLRYRNKLAHRKAPDTEEFTFKESLTILNRMLDLIPE